ncbi:DUF2778 domain-containing protein [Pseudomonas syringae]|uniref:DUF2778 domain-containing protein n=1 Tax=Pseudomonas syringae TaxID=317 RepID=UPI0009B036F8|nr:DUF2778 domain-containing protein [Pseudomonas syringae]
MTSPTVDTNKVAYCTFELNSLAISFLKCSNNESYEAFSGLTFVANDPNAVNNANEGPLPPGRYYILDRESGGRLGWLKDPIQDAFARTDRSDWFSLYRDDGHVDDETFVDNVARRNFRMHPVGPMGISEGCVTLMSKSGFYQLSKYLHNMEGDRIKGAGQKYFGILDVIDPRNK